MVSLAESVHQPEGSFVYIHRFPHMKDHSPMRQATIFLMLLTLASSKIATADSPIEASTSARRTVMNFCNSIFTDYDLNAAMTFVADDAKRKNEGPASMKSFWNNPSRLRDARQTRVQALVFFTKAGIDRISKVYPNQLWDNKADWPDDTLMALVALDIIDRNGRIVQGQSEVPLILLAVKEIKGKAMIVYSDDN